MKHTFNPPSNATLSINRSMSKKVALITGLTGQDGSYLAELLLTKGYHVHGIIRRSSSFNTGRIEHIRSQLKLHYGDLTDSTNLISILTQCQPDEVYNLAAQSHVKVSFEMAEYTADVDGVGTLRLLDAIRSAGLASKVRFYQASTSELYGLVQQIPQNEETPFYPRSPYGVAKLFAYWIVVNYRESYGMFAVNGILFNHESPRRGETFVTRKIAKAAAHISKGKQDCLYLGNLDSKRDWGFAGDYIEAMWLILQAEKPVDYVVATGETRSVREFVEKCFDQVGLKIHWEGKGLDEVGLDQHGKAVVRIKADYFRPAEVDLLLGDPTKIEKELGWKRRVSFDALVEEMVEAELKALSNQ